MDALKSVRHLLDKRVKELIENRGKIKVRVSVPKEIGIWKKLKKFFFSLTF